MLVSNVNVWNAYIIVKIEKFCCHPNLANGNYERGVKITALAMNGWFMIYCALLTLALIFISELGRFIFKYWQPVYSASTWFYPMLIYDHWSVWYHRMTCYSHSVKVGYFEDNFLEVIICSVCRQRGPGRDGLGRWLTWQCATDLSAELIMLSSKTTKVNLTISLSVKRHRNRWGRVRQHARSGTAQWINEASH